MLHRKHFPGKVRREMQHFLPPLAELAICPFKGSIAMHNNIPTSARANFSVRTALTFLVVGGFATGMQYAVMALLIWLLDLPVVWASTIGFAVSAIANYLLNARLTFRTKKTHASTLPRFVATAGAGLVLNSLILAGLTSFGMHVAPAQLITTICVLIWNYIINAIWTFKQQVP